MKFFLNFIFVSVIIVASGIAGYAVVNHDRFLFDGFNQIAFLGLPVALVILAFFALRSRVEAKANILLLLISVVFSVYLSEVALKTFSYLSYSPSPGKDHALKVGRAYDERSKIEVLDDLKKTDPHAVPSAAPFNWRNEPFLRADGSFSIFPLTGVAKRLSVMCNESGKWTIFRSDRYGYRNDDSVWDSKVQIALVGDSFTFGSCVDEEFTSISYIKRSYPATANFGLVGHGPLLMLATIKEYIARFQPKVVFWVYYAGNDFPSDLFAEANHPVLPSYLETGFTQNLWERQDEAQSFVKQFVEKVAASERAQKNQGVKRPPFVGSWREIAFLGSIRDLLGLGRQRELPNYELFKQVLAEARSTVNAWGGTLVFVYQGGWGQVTEKETSLSAEVRIEVLKIVSELGIDLVDTLPEMLNTPERETLFAFPSSHYGDKGYKIVGELMKQWLDKNRSKLDLDLTKESK